MTDSVLAGPQAADRTHTPPSAPTERRSRRGLSLLSNVKVRTRLLTLAGVVAVLWALVVVFSFTGLGSIKHSNDVSNRRTQQVAAVKGADLAWFTEDDVMHVYAGLVVLQSGSNAAEIRQMWGMTGQYHQRALADLNAVVKNPPNATTLALAKKTIADLDAYQKFVMAVHTEVLKGSPLIADETATVQYLQSASTLSSDFSKMEKNIASAVATAQGRIGSSISHTKTLLWIVTVASILIGILAMTLIILSITRPLARLTTAAHRFARGAVDIDVQVHGNDEIATVADSFREAIVAQKQLSGGMLEFSAGHIGVAFAPRSEDDVLGHAFVEMQGQMRTALGDRATTRELQAGMGELLDTLQTLDQGLAGMAAGDLTIAVSSELQPIRAADAGEELGFVGERYNEMLVAAQRSIEGYNAMRETLRAKLGDSSSLEALATRMDSLTNNCLSNLQLAMQAMNEGNLTIDVMPHTERILATDGKQPGELAEVFNVMLDNTQAAITAYNGMRAKVAAMLAEISQSSGSLSSASTQMASTSEEAGRAIAEIANAVNSVAQGAEQQVRSVDDVKRITDELAQASRLSAEAADETSAAADEARTLAREGVAAADNAATAMQAVRDSSTGASAAIRSLGQKSDQIGGIVATITSIAAQTNLLALNAAIEAARAGEHGRGFAVVAEEVRHLAEESQSAAANIGALIEEIQHETAKAVDVVQVGADQTRDGVATVEQARDAFVQIGQSVEDMSSRVEQIAASIRQIAASGDQVRDSMNEVAAVAEESSASTEEVSASTEQTSASTQQIAASAQQLAITADELERLVSQFTLV